MAIAKVRQLRKSIEKLSQWEGSGNAFGFVEGISENKTNYIYEFFCAIKVLNDLNTHHNIKLCPGKKGYKFAINPGIKSEWAKFIISKSKSSNEPLYDLCMGVSVKISMSPQTTFAADISIQDPNSEDPDESHVVLIMDAKYRKSSKATLDIGIIREFAQCARDMQVPKRLDGLKFNKLVDLASNCLLTNGELINEHEQYCKNNKIKQVGRFDCDNRQMIVVG
ncbi:MULTISPECIES: hypothetical protein [Niastella]|uniref:Restriction endonuclease n=1 Tax=Niastella soli TaxID=2821487 RepID=A0ABS3YRV2_9BACT|nr:hypothetical protein [Niastella soli]MBO9200610.1 hypothetical protein [Niastella soli]